MEAKTTPPVSPPKYKSNGYLKKHEISINSFFNSDISFEEVQQEVIDHGELNKKNNLITYLEFLLYLKLRSVPDLWLFNRFRRSTSLKLITWMNSIAEGIFIERKENIFLKNRFLKFTASEDELDNAYRSQERELADEKNLFIFNQTVILPIYRTKRLNC